MSFWSCTATESPPMGLVGCTITQDAQSHAMPDGKRPRNHITMTAASSLWRIFAVINDCKAKTESNLQIIDGGIKRSSKVNRCTGTYFKFEIQRRPEKIWI